MGQKPMWINHVGAKSTVAHWWRKVMWSIQSSVHRLCCLKGTVHKCTIMHRVCDPKTKYFLQLLEQNPKQGWVQVGRGGHHKACSLNGWVKIVLGDFRFSIELMRYRSKDIASFAPQLDGYFSSGKCVLETVSWSATVAPTKILFLVNIQIWTS